MADYIQIKNGTTDVLPVSGEYGTNSNGSYLKLSNGVLFCWKTVSFTGIATSSAWGSCYETSSTKSFGSWPLAFIETPVVLAYPHRISGTVTIFTEQFMDVSTTSCGSAYLYSPKSNNNVSCAFVIVGIGRWK